MCSQFILYLVYLKCVHNVLTNYNSISRSVFKMCSYSVMCVSACYGEMREERENRKEMEGEIGEKTENYFYNHSKNWVSSPSYSRY